MKGDGWRVLLMGISGMCTVLIKTTTRLTTHHDQFIGTDALLLDGGGKGILIQIQPPRPPSSTSLMLMPRSAAKAFSIGSSVVSASSCSQEVASQ